MRQVPLDNDWEFEYAVTRKNAGTGLPEAAAGLVGITGRFSASDGGAAIDALLSAAATERSGVPGTYYGVIEGDNLRSKAASYVGKPVWFVFGDGLNVFVSELVQIAPVRHP